MIGLALETTAVRTAPIIEFQSVSKTYSRGASRGFLRHYLVSYFRRSPEDTFYALRDVSFAMRPGESLAVIGHNGAGKSTLLNLVAGVTYPEKGNVSINGTVVALLELGSGFHPDLSGAENVMLNASVLGLTRKKTLERFDSIVEFAELGEFINEPLRTYSTGMAMRLAFSVAVNVEPDILVIDEVLAVGDQNFQAKCIGKIHEFREAGRTLLCVSHAVGLLESLCDRALWLDHGHVVMCGPTKEVLRAYQAKG